MSAPKTAFHTQRQKKVHHFFFMINKLREKRKKDQCHFQLFHESLSLKVCISSRIAIFRMLETSKSGRDEIHDDKEILLKDQTSSSADASP